MCDALQKPCSTKQEKLEGVRCECFSVPHLVGPQAVVAIPRVQHIADARPHPPGAPRPLPRRSLHSSCHDLTQAVSVQSPRGTC